MEREPYRPYVGAMAKPKRRHAHTISAVIGLQERQQQPPTLGKVIEKWSNTCYVPNTLPTKRLRDNKIAWASDLLSTVRVKERERDSELECAKRMMRTTQYALVNIKLIYSAEHTHTLSHTFRKSFKVFRMRSTSSLYRWSSCNKTTPVGHNFIWSVSLTRQISNVFGNISSISNAVLSMMLSRLMSPHKSSVFPRFFFVPIG